MGVFRYACRDRAHLFLGASESADEETFEALDGKHHIFVARNREGGRLVLPELLAIPAGRPSRRETRRSPAAESHLAALEGASPPSVLIDDRWNVLHLSASASKFFQQSGGTLARRVTELVRAELRDELHALLHRVHGMTEGRLSRFVPVKFNGDPTWWRCLLNSGRLRRRASRTFSSHFSTRVRDGNGSPSARRSAPGGTSNRKRTRRPLSCNEDLRAANEELRSLNEKPCRPYRKRFYATE